MVTKHTNAFYEGMKTKMRTFRAKVISTRYDHILPQKFWYLNLWQDIRKKAITYFKSERIKWHREQDNLLSSQILCVNIFFPLREHLHLLEGFLRQFYPSLEKVTYIDFEYVGPKDKNYFNERGGRGFNRTSADVAIFWKDNENRNNLLLVEFKFTEKEFGGCAWSENQDRSRCMNAELIISSQGAQCYRTEKRRTYWEKILSNGPFVEEALTRRTICPFKYDFYQLMRGQLLAHCIANEKDAKFNNVEFAACYDGRNETLQELRRPINGDSNPFTAWQSFLRNPKTFRHFGIQNLLQSIDNNLPNELIEWREYLRSRYGL